MPMIAYLLNNMDDWSPNFNRFIAIVSMLLSLYVLIGLGSRRISEW